MKLKDWLEKAKVHREKLVPVLLCLPQIQQEPPEIEPRTLWLEETSIFSSVIRQNNQVAYIRIHE